MKNKILLTVLIFVVGISLAFAGDELSDFGDFFDDTSTEESAVATDSPVLNITGKALLDTEDYVSLDDNPIVSNPSLSLDMNYVMDNSDLYANIKLDQNLLKNNPAGILNEFVVKAYLGDIVLDAGKEKVVWGRGDKLHVLDLICANDYSNFLIPDYIDRRIAENKLGLTWYLPKNITLQLAYTPTMTPDNVPTDGIWAPEEAKNLVNTATSVVAYKASTAYKTAYDNTFALLTLLSSPDAASLSQLAGAKAALEVQQQFGSEEAFLPNTNQLKYSQYGLRLTGTIGSFDFGAQYYLGHYKTPSATITMGTGLDMQPTATDLNLHYDKLQVFGTDFEGIVGPVNLRGELAYYLTEDTDGTKPGIHNSSIQYVGGADIGLPVNNMDLNVQVIGSYILNNDKIVSPLDMDYRKDGKWSNNKIVFMLSDAWMHEKLKPSLTTIWGIEREDLAFIPKVEYALTDGMKISASGAYFVDLEGNNSEFETYEDNNFIGLSMKYSF